MALWKLFVASMWFKLYYHMVSNMLVAHTILFWRLLLLVAVWRAERSSSERSCAACRRVETTGVLLPTPCHASCSALAGEWKPQRCSCRRHAMRPAQPLPASGNVPDDQGTSTLIMKEGSIGWWWCTGVMPSDRRRLLLGANRSALTLIQQSHTQLILVSSSN
jgi:hypothetical protein